MKNLLKNWWNGLRFEPGDPRYLAGGEIKVAVIGGGTGLANLLTGLKSFSNQISAIVTVADDGSSSGKLRKEFDILPPGDIRKCISALSYNEELISRIFEFRFPNDKRFFGGHTLGNIWLTGLTNQLGSFEKAIEVTTEIFQTAGNVLPSTLSNIDLCVEYDDGTEVVGESNLDELVKNVKRVTLNKKGIKAYGKAVAAIKEANLIVLGPGSLYGSIIPNLLISGIRNAIKNNQRAVKVYVVNCSTERTQTRGYSVDDHINAINSYTGRGIVDYALVNSRIIRKSRNESKLGEVNNITTDKTMIGGYRIVLSDVVDEKNPLYHDAEKLAKNIIKLYNTVRHN